MEKIKEEMEKKKKMKQNERYWEKEHFLLKI